MSYGNQGPQDTYDRLNNARQITNRDPYIEKGNHTLAVESLEEFQHETGPAVRATFEVLESTAHAIGSRVATVWFLNKPTPKPGMVSDADRFADFCVKLKGAPAGYPIGADIRVLLKTRASEQLARGMVIKVNGVEKVAKTTGKSYTMCYWTNVVQSPQDILALRQRIEAKMGPAPQAQAQPAYVAPAPAGVPQGGFLANVPTSNGNGGQGGW